MITTMNGGVTAALRCREAVLRWSEALPARTYWFAALPAEDVQPRRMIHRRVWHHDEIEQGLVWLRHLNSRGHHVIGRPVGSRHILVDDLTPIAAADLARTHRPAAVVASSPGSLQVWITAADEDLEPAVASAIARILATRFGGDRGAASARQPGRVPGFTNRKPKHRDSSGRFPYATLLRADGPCVDPAGKDLVAEAEEALACAYRRQPSEVLPVTHAAESRRRGFPSPGEEHAEATRRVKASLPYGATIDRSRLDFAIARRVLNRGLSMEEGIAVVVAGEKAGAMSADAAQAYATRTVSAARLGSARGPRDNADC